MQWSLPLATGVNWGWAMVGFLCCSIPPFKGGWRWGSLATQIPLVAMVIVLVQEQGLLAILGTQCLGCRSILDAAAFGKRGVPDPMASSSSAPRLSLQQFFPQLLVHAKGRGQGRRLHNIPWMYATPLYTHW